MKSIRTACLLYFTREIQRSGCSQNIAEWSKIQSSFEDLTIVRGSHRLAGKNRDAYQHFLLGDTDADVEAMLRTAGR